MTLPIEKATADLTPQQKQDVSEEANQYLTFRLRDEMYAIGILRTKEILEYRPITQVPMMPDFVHGVINLRGAVVPVIDLAMRFDGARTKIRKRSCIVIVEVEGNNGRQDISIIVDEVSEVVSIPAEEIEPSPSFGTRIRTDFIAGMGKLEGDFVIILAVDNVLSVDELSRLEGSGNDAHAKALPFEPKTQSPDDEDQPDSDTMHIETDSDTDQ
ncbi:chemotaxis protein CheW [Aliidiomarina sedimenti]|uniref:Chemotaxis protein CheW n=1 Tax=Aliidiomarina sedimenti TaxID=1933879 RepID=A0ABY0C2D5_9GAMM|nr:chemotaxis protein CheW [Aliidiomarina sedimenti]RUO31910.1 chemotaxis protein CheW [Aliidiomarina sedimenti]